jgi:hypothetical protein
MVSPNKAMRAVFGFGNKNQKKAKPKKALAPTFRAARTSEGLSGSILRMVTSMWYPLFAYFLPIS